MYNLCADGLFAALSPNLAAPDPFFVLWPLPHPPSTKTGGDASSSTGGRSRGCARPAPGRDDARPRLGLSVAACGPGLGRRCRRRAVPERVDCCRPGRVGAAGTLDRYRGEPWNRRAGNPVASGPVSDQNETDPIDRVLAEIEASVRASVPVARSPPKSRRSSTRNSVSSSAHPRSRSRRSSASSASCGRSISIRRNRRARRRSRAANSCTASVSTTVRRHNQEQAEQLRALRTASPTGQLRRLGAPCDRRPSMTERRHRRTVADLRAEFADLWRLIGSRDGTA